MSDVDIIKEPTATRFLNKTRLSAGSVKLALTALEKNDHIEQYQGGFRIIDPMLKSILQG